MVYHCLISEGPSSFPLVFNWSPDRGLRTAENSRPCTILKSTSWGVLQDALFGGMILPSLIRKGERHRCCAQRPPHRNAVSILERDKSLDLAVLFPGQPTNFGKLRRSFRGLPWWLSGKESACQCWRHGFHPLSGKIPYTTAQLNPCTTSTEPGCYNC